MSSMNEMKGISTAEDGEVDEGPLSESSLLEETSDQQQIPEEPDGPPLATGGSVVRPAESSRYYNLSTVQQEALLSSLESNPATQSASVRPPSKDDPYHLSQALIHDRLEDLKFSLEMQAAAGMAGEEGVQEWPKSPRRDGTHFRQTSDPKNEFYFQSVSDYDLTAGELESNPSSSVPPSPLMTARTADRATSPSVASVASGASSVGGAGHVRRHLEWDSAADLGLSGLGGSRVPQSQAAASLSTLEKLAIGNYSNYFSSRADMKDISPRPPPPPFNQHKGRRILPPGPPEAETEMRQARLNKFADSLIRQRQLRQMVAASSAAAAAATTTGMPPPKSVPPKEPVIHAPTQQRRSNRRRRSKSAEKSKSYNATPESSPSRRRKPPPSSSRHRNKTKSTSLTDLEKLTPKDQQPSAIRTAWVEEEGSSVISHQQQPPVVVPILFDDGAAGSSRYQPAARAFRASPDVSTGKRDASQTSLSSSRQSGSRSYETVIDASEQQKPSGRHSHHHQMPRVMDSDSFDTEDEMQLAQHAAVTAAAGSHHHHHPTAAPARRPPQLPHPYFYQRRRENVWTSSGERDNRANSLPAEADALKAVSSAGGGTTSEDENKNPRPAAAAASSTNNNSTMESQGRTEKAAGGGGNAGRGGGTSGPTTIDRAKSFEYFPGETFQAQLQENSSSYEYLPGHLLDRGRRPGTVVSNREDAPDRLSSTHGNEGSTSSDGAGDRGGEQVKGCRHQNVVTDSGPSSLERGQRDTHMEQLSADLMNRYQDLHSAQVAKMKDFYGKLQHKLDFISEPSSTAEDSRAKQAVADKLMRVLRQEEHKMTSRLTTTDPVIPTPRHFDFDNNQDSGGGGGGGGGPKRGFRRKKTNQEQSKQMTNDLMPPPPPVSSLQSLTTQMMTLTASAKDAEIQKMRIAQMKTLRREIRKLEKIEALRLAQEAQQSGQRPGTTLKDLSLQSSFDSLATDVTDLMLHDRVPATSAATKVDEGVVAAKGGASCHSEKKDFGQTCPTPKEAKETDRKNDEKRKSLAYYLPLNNSSRTSSLSSSTGERKVLRSVRNAGAPPPDRHLEEESMMGKENRDILANYMSSLSTTNTATGTRGKKKPKQPLKPPSKPSNNRCSLQQALAECHPEFIRRSQARVDVLREIREEREAHSDLCKKWIIQHNVGGEFSVPANLPKQPRQRRLFNYNQMVAETRAKYHSLPEVVNARLEVKKRSQENTNRLMALMYKRKIKDKVLKKARMPNNNIFM